MKLSQIVILAAAQKGQCARCGKPLKGKSKSPQFICPKCKEEVKSYGEEFVDPNGQQWFNKVVHRLPLVKWTPTYR